jgi:outer membrane receptor protein involved in Fe transport
MRSDLRGRFSEEVLRSNCWVTLHLLGRLVFCVVALLVSCLATVAQTTTGRILGSVRDSQEAAVVGAKVTITDVQRNTVRVVLTDESGDYIAPELEPSTYKVLVEAKGFNSFQAPGILLEVGKDVRVDATLKPGDSNIVVTITEGIPLIDTTTSSLGGTLSNKEINDLPLNGRNYENLLQLRPGVVRYPGGGFSTTSSNGLRAEDNAYLVDGLFNSEPFSGQSIINGAGIAGDSATILPVDAIQEFNVVQNPPAEYGYKPGAVVNVGLKSGTNDFHGTAYGFLRSKFLDARNFFNPVGQAMTPRSLKQFGGTVGGPIRTDKLFFFGGYEGARYKVGNSGSIATPSMVDIPTPAGSATNCLFIPSGDCVNSIPDAIADLQAGGIPISPVSLALAHCTLGPPVTCDGKGFATNLNPVGTIFAGLPNEVNADNAIGKVDFHPNEQNTISGSYFFGNNSGTVEDSFQLQPQWLTQIHTRAQVVGANWVTLPSPRWVNEARFGYNRLYQPTFTADHNVSASTYGINTGVTNPLFGGLPIITILPFSVPNTLGGFVWPKIQGPDTRAQFVDHLTYVHGKNTFKFGGEIHHDTFSGAAFAGGRGRIKFLGGSFVNAANAPSSGLEDFFGGAPAVASVLIGDPSRNIHNWSYAGFMQDDWRVTSHVTLNLGLRYELSTVVKADHNLLANFDPNLGDVQVGQQIKAPYQGNHANFAPRLGVAWDPFGNGKTVFRAGGGITYESINWESFLAFNNTLGIGSIPTGSANGVQPGGGTITVGNINLFPSTTQYNTGPIFPSGANPVNCSANPCNILGIDPRLATPFVYTYTINVQRALTNKVSLEVAYVGDHGSRLIGIHDINQAAAGSGWQPCIASNFDIATCAAGAMSGLEQAGRPFTSNCPPPVGLGTGGPCFPFLAAVYQMGNIYKSNYNGLQTTLTMRDFHGFTALAGYTYSHALDDVGANWDFGQGLGLPQDAFHPQREYASSDFDIRNRFTLSVTYAVPGKKSFGQLLEGWQVNSIVTLASAQPWGPTDSSHDVSGTGEATIAATGIDRWDFIGKPSDFTSGPVPLPFFPGSTNLSNPPTANTACNAAATTQALQTSLRLFGCYAKGNSIMIPPAIGTFGTMGRNVFRDSGFRNWDASVMKNWKLYERLSAQLRLEVFNILNHANFANPFGGQNGFGTGGFNDPSAPGLFGCGCATPDKAAANPVIGSGGSRAVQLGLKLTF